MSSSLGWTAHATRHKKTRANGNAMCPSRHKVDSLYLHFVCVYTVHGRSTAPYYFIRHSYNVVRQDRKYMAVRQTSSHLNYIFFVNREMIAEQKWPGHCIELGQQLADRLRPICVVVVASLSVVCAPPCMICTFV